MEIPETYATSPLRLGPHRLIVNFQRIGTPADAKDIIAVGAVDVQGSLASFSARGPTSDGRIKPEVCAPGKSVVVALANGGYGLSSGTSFATPHTAGLAALLLQAHPEWTNLELRDAIISTASKSAAPNVDFGWGIVQGVAALSYVPGMFRQFFDAARFLCYFFPSYL